MHMIFISTKYTMSTLITNMIDYQVATTYKLLGLQIYDRAKPSHECKRLRAKK